MGGPGGLGPLSSKKLFVRGAQGALKISRVLNCERLAFRAGVLKLVGVKDLQGGHEHSSDLMIERIYSKLFFVKHQNLFPQNSCILPITSIKTLQINCFIFYMFCSMVSSAVSKSSSA